MRTTTKHKPFLMRAATTLLLATLMLAAVPQRAWADTETVSYIDADGKAKTVTATVLTGSEPVNYGSIELAAGWYVVKNTNPDGVDVSYTNQIGYESGSSTIHIILADGAEMAVNYSNIAIKLSNDYPLAIYGQSAGTGRLTLTSERNAISAPGGLTINGGIVSATSTGDNCSAIYTDDAALTINGGQLTATPGSNAKGIGSGTITLGGGTVTSYGGYYGTVTVALPDGYAYSDGTDTYSNGTLTSEQVAAIAGKTLSPAPDPDHFSQSDDTYTIHTTEGWGVFCDLLEGGESFGTKTVKLDADISVTRMAGGSNHAFSGTFDGQGNTLTVNYGSASEPLDAQFVAPFVETATGTSPTFRNLNIDGHIYAAYTGSGDPGVGGLIGHLFGTVTIEGCTSTVEINSTKDRVGGFVGLCEHTVTFTNCKSSAVVTCTGSGSGFVGWSRASDYTIAFEGCLFDGKILKKDNVGSGNGGFVGWKGDAKTVTVTNSLVALDGVGSMASGSSATFARGWNGTPTNSYYTAAFGTAQGKQARTVAAGDNVTLGLSGTDTEYDVSGITAYEGNRGIKYGTTYYAGTGDQLELTLGNTAPLGYQYDGYTASAGTLSGSTLTMPDEDVTISLVLTVIPWTGSGDTKDAPFIIQYPSQLDLLAHRVNGTHGETLQEDGYDGKYFRLANDITYTHDTDWDDATSEENNYEAIGGYYGSKDRYFRGDFDGAGHTISGIRIHHSGSDDADKEQGIFGQTDGANIHGLRLADARITGYKYTGGIVGYNEGTVTDCHVASNVCIHAVQSNADYHGGIVGSNEGTVENCTSAATLTILSGKTGCERYGAIAGYNDGTLSDNLAIGTTVPATGNNSYGAIVGRNYGTLQRNYYTACKVASTDITPSGVGYQNADVTENDGAVPALRDNADNTQAIVLLAALAQTDDDRPVLPLDLGWGEGQFPLQLASRTLYKDGKWNTLCLPFDVTVSGSVLDGAVARPLNEAYISGTTLSLTFGDAVTTLVAGTPYIIKWAKADDYVDDDAHNIVNPVFEGVTVSTDKHDYDTAEESVTTDERVRFVGTYKSTAFDSEDTSILLMGAANTLYYPTTGAGIGAQRAYFKIGGDEQTLLARRLTSFSIDFGDDDNTTSIISIDNGQLAIDNSWYSLDGRKLAGKPTQSGIYINNGKKVVIK